MLDINDYHNKCHCHSSVWAIMGYTPSLYLHNKWALYQYRSDFCYIAIDENDNKTIIDMIVYDFADQIQFLTKPEFLKQGLSCLYLFIFNVRVMTQTINKYKLNIY